MTGMKNRCESCRANACCRKCARFVQSVIWDYGHCGVGGPVVRACGSGAPCPWFSQYAKARRVGVDFVVYGEDSRD